MLTISPKVDMKNDISESNYYPLPVIATKMIFINLFLLNLSTVIFNNLNTLIPNQSILLNLLTLIFDIFNYV